MSAFCALPSSLRRHRAYRARRDGPTLGSVQASICTGKVRRSLARKARAECCRRTSLLSEHAPPPGDDRSVHLVGLFFLSSVAAAAHEMLGQIGDESVHARRRELRRIQFGRDHEGRSMHGPVATGCVFPVAGDVAIPVDPAGEAAPSEGLDEDLQLLLGHDRRPGVSSGVVGLNKADEILVGARPRATGFFARQGTSKQRVEDLVDILGEDPVGSRLSFAEFLSRAASQWDRRARASRAAS